MHKFSFREKVRITILFFLAYELTFFIESIITTFMKEKQYFSAENSISIFLIKTVFITFYPSITLTLNNYLPSKKAAESDLLETLENKYTLAQLAIRLVIIFSLVALIFNTIINYIFGIIYSDLYVFEFWFSVIAYSRTAFLAATMFALITILTMKVEK